MTHALQGLELVAFDLDDTLAPSKSRIDPEMAELLTGLLPHVRVCIISGGRFEQFDTQVLANLPTALDAVTNGDASSGSAAETALARMHLMPTCGTQYYERQDGAWTRVYAEDLSEPDKQRVVEVLTAGAKELGLWESQTWGPIIEDRGSQITFSALGQQAPVDAKHAWDPDGVKKERLRTYAAPLLPELEVRGGGSTSIDVTRKGVDKAYGMAKLLERLDLRPDQVLFVGDRLDPGGNDYPVKSLGIRTVAVEQWQHTAVFVRGMIATFEQAALAPASA
ncbi:HAD-IIB family hydrolase [Nakamurella leprariae]|uniref:HAD-IIB family hydrolase n=1 Tax=Nakamurella leprariae TaxID=2803911 RepID=A0A938YEM3_9ACTN|nr:HAD-IIB family hydrolase [Nakamurella leprariae]MBM9468439.1 HAD-IIB family hydrolase [Nakamurella leprariae]